MPVAGKTGTATNNNDLWFVGFTPYYTAAVWTGYDNNFNQINKSYQQDLWRNIMEDIHSTKQLEKADWEMPDSIVTANICSKCGKLAVAGLCDQAEGGSCVVTEYFAKGTVPTEKCTCHVRVDICESTGKIATENCPHKKLKSKVLLVKDEYYKTDPETMLPIDPPELITTWDTPYIYHPDDVCTKHLPDGAYLDEEGNVRYYDEGSGDSGDSGAGADEGGDLGPVG